MKKYTGLVFVAANCLMPAQCQQKDDPRCINFPATPALSVTLTASKTHYGPGEPIPVIVMLQNIGKADIVIPTAVQEQSHWVKFSVKGIAGEIDHIGPEYKLLHLERGLTLYQEHFYGREFKNLAEIFALGKPGSYTVQATYGESPLRQCDLGRHASNTIRLHIGDIREAEAKEIAKGLYLRDSTEEIVRIEASLAIMNDGKITLVNAGPNSVVSGIKDGDAEEIRLWQARLNGRSFWIVTIFDAKSGHGFMIDARTGQDVRFR